MKSDATSSSSTSRGYSEEEIESIYELARLFLETGQARRAEIIVNGLVEVAPDFVPGLLLRAVLYALNGELDSALQVTSSALKQQAHSIEAILILAACALSLNDANSAGTYLGEAGELLEGSANARPEAKRFYKMQLARYQARA